MPKSVVVFWERILLATKNLWARCAQRVDELWQCFGQLARPVHNRPSNYVVVWENSCFMHRLYKFYTQVFPTLKPFDQPLLFLTLSTSSTGPIKRTKVQRKDYL